MKLVLTLLILLNCQVDPEYKNFRKSVYIAPTFLPYYKKFCLDFNIDPLFVSAKWAPMQDNVLGQCWSNATEWLLYIDPDKWQYTDMVQREALVYHELLHCTVNAEHTDALLDDKCPASLMHPVLVSTSCYKAHKPDYVKEYYRETSTPTICQP